MDHETKLRLHQLSNILNDNLDIFIKRRDSSASQDKYYYRYICRKLEVAIGSVNKAIDKITTIK